MSEFKLNQPEKRLHDRLPKVGIHYSIDGRRRGIRESLEGQTDAHGPDLAKLISGHVQHANGMAVECVIPQPPSVGLPETAKCAELFEREGVGLTITVTPCWAYGY